MRRLLAGLTALLVCLVLLMGEPHRDRGAEALAHAQLLLAQGQMGEALIALHQALPYRPGDPDLLVQLYELSLRLNRLDLSAQYASLLAAKGWTADDYHRTARTFVRQGDKEAGAFYYRASLAGAGRLEARDLPALHLLLAESLHSLDWKTAQTYLEWINRVDPRDYEAAFGWGLMLAPSDQAGSLAALARAAAELRFQPAVSALNQLFAAYPDEPVPVRAYRIGLMIVGFSIDSFDSLPYAEYALSIAAKEGGYPAATAFLGVARLRRGQDGSALVERALLLNADDPMVNLGAGIYYRLVGNLDQALNVLNFARSLAPENPSIAAEIGLVYRAKGMAAEASFWLDAAAKLAPEDSSFLALLATFYADDNYDLTGNGLNALEKIAARLPDNAEVQACYGWALLAAQRTEEARTTLGRALGLNPSSLRARYYFGVLLETQGDVDGAIDSYRKVYDAGESPFQALAGRALARLGQ